MRGLFIVQLMKTRFIFLSFKRKAYEFLQRFKSKAGLQHPSNRRRFKIYTEELLRKLYKVFKQYMKKAVLLWKNETIVQKMNAVVADDGKTNILINIRVKWLLILLHILYILSKPVARNH